MSPAVREARTAVMIRVEVSWEDASGNFRSVSARMEDKSLSGACIRVKTPIDVGSKVRVQWRFEQFSGVVKYCRLEDWDYVVGMRRDGANGGSTDGGARVEAESARKTKDNPSDAADGAQSVGAETDGAKTGGTQTKVRRDLQTHVRRDLQTNVQRLTEAQEITAGKVLPVVKPLMDDEPVVRGADRSGGAVAEELKAEFRAERGREVRTRVRARAIELPKERKSMARKWLGLTPWLKKHDGVSEGGAASKTNGEGKREKESSMPEVIASAIGGTDEQEVESRDDLQIEFLPVEDVYRAAGMTNPQKRYSIHKVVEMLNSEHLGGLSKEMRRAAVLMALDAAGISIEDVQRDAKARQDVLDRYEAEQKEQVEAEWARKAQENIQTQEELERVKARYMARIGRNLEGVAREKAAVGSWVAAKQQEIQSISEVVELCVRPAVIEPSGISVSAPMAKAAIAGADAPGSVASKG